MEVTLWETKSRERDLDTITQTTIWLSRLGNVVQRYVQLGCPYTKSSTFHNLSNIHYHSIPNYKIKKCGCYTNIWTKFSNKIMNFMSFLKKNLLLQVMVQFFTNAMVRKFLKG